MFALVIIVVAVFGAVITLGVAIFEEKIKPLIIAIICAVIVVSMISHVKYMQDSLPSHYVQDWKANISALQDSKDIYGQFSGSMFASRGYIGEDLVYYYVVNTVKGKMVNKVSSTYTYLDDSKKDVVPSIACGHYEFIDKNWWTDVFWTVNPNQKNECYLVVPTGTITDAYNIDMK